MSEPGESELRHPASRESHLKNKLDLQQLVDIWDTERPWETPPTPGGLKNLFRRNPQPPRVRSYGHDEMGRTENPDFVKAGRGKGNNEYDVRGWILSKLGLPDNVMNEGVITATESHKLIAKGLGISRFHAAILDHATRSIPQREIDEMFRDALLHPEKFITYGEGKEFSTSELSQLAEEMTKLDKDNWTAIQESMKDRPDGWIHSPEYKKYRELERQPDIRYAPYVDAFRDVVYGAIEDKGGNKYDHGVHEFPMSLAILVAQEEMTIQEAQELLDAVKKGTNPKHPDDTYTISKHDRDTFNQIVGPSKTEFPDEDS